jgi:hypothetical protein
MTTVTDRPRITPGPVDLVQTERQTVAHQRRAAARARELTALLSERPELSGVYAPADFAVDAVRWSA